MIKAVREAALHELGRVGFAALTMDAVIRRARVSRTTVYRRWPNKGALVTSLLDQMQERLREDPQTDSLREDLRQILKALSSNIATPAQREVTVALNSGIEGMSELQMRSRQEGVRPLVDAFLRAQGRKEAGREDDPELLSRLLFDAVVWRTIEVAREMTRPELDVYIDVVLRSLRPPVAKKKRVR